MIFIFQGLATRHRPSGEGLRAGVLRRDESSSSITSQASSNIPPKNSLGLTVNINRVTVSPARETEWKISNGSSQQTTTQGNSPQSKPTTVEPQSNSPSQTNSQPSTRPHPPTPHPKPPQAGKAPMSFLAEIQAAQKRRGLEESPEPSPPQPKQSPQRPQTANQGTSHNGGGEKTSCKVSNPPVTNIVLGAGSLQEQLRSRLEARKRSVEDSEAAPFPNQESQHYPENRSTIQVSSSKGEFLFFAFPAFLSFVLPASVTGCFSVRKSGPASGPASPATQTHVTSSGPPREQDHHHPPHAHHPHPMPKPPAVVPQHSVTHHAQPTPHHSTTPHHSPGVVLISQKPLESHHSHGHNHIGESLICSTNI